MARAKADYGQLNVKLYSQFYTYFDDTAESVSASNKKGRFDILPGHTDFFTLLTADTVRIMSGGQVFEHKINHGVGEVANNRVRLFVDV